jgi:hypothetical protein
VNPQEDQGTVVKSLYDSLRSAMQAMANAESSAHGIADGTTRATLLKDIEALQIALSRVTEAAEAHLRGQRARSGEQE